MLVAACRVCLVPALRWSVRAALVSSALACGDPTAARAFGALNITISTSGAALDRDGYELRIDERPALDIPINGSISNYKLDIGVHRFTLSGVESNCQLDEPDLPTVTVEAGATSSLTIRVRCEPRILFASRRDGNWELYVINADGTDERRLTNNLVDDLAPAWSPDYSKIAFQSHRDGNYEIYTMNSDGSSPTNLTRHPDSDEMPAWSRDGSRIAYVSRGFVRAIGSDEIFVMNADGSTQTRLTYRDDANNLQPSYSPDGASLAFVSGRDGNLDIFAMRPDGSNPNNLTRSRDTDATPTWSPDGARLAFTSFRDGNWEIYLMLSNGTGQVNLTHSQTVAEGQPSWSLDGSRIVFVSDRSGNSELWVMNADGSAATRLTHSGSNADPAWIQ